MNKTLAKKITGGLSNTTKLPCFSFNLSALHCNVGAKLTNIKNSVCYGCYALKGFYAKYGHINKMKYKTDLINNTDWTQAMTYLIKNQG